MNKNNELVDLIFKALQSVAEMSALITSEEVKLVVERLDLLIDWMTVLREALQAIEARRM